WVWSLNCSASPRPPVLFRARIALTCGIEIIRAKDLSNFSLALPTGPVFPVKLHELYSGIDHLLLRLNLKDGVAADNLFRLSKRAVKHQNLPLCQSDAVTDCGWGQPSRLQQCAAFRCILAKFRNRLHQCWRGRARILRGLYQGHKSHNFISFNLLSPRLRNLTVYPGFY